MRSEELKILKGILYQTYNIQDYFYCTLPPIMRNLPSYDYLYYEFRPCVGQRFNCIILFIKSVEIYF